MTNRREVLKSASLALVGAGFLAPIAPRRAEAADASNLLRELSDYAVAGFGNINRPVAQRLQLAAGVVDARFDANLIGYNAIRSFYNPRNPRLKNTQADTVRFTNEFLPRFRVQIIYNLTDLFEDYTGDAFRIDGEFRDANTAQTRVDASYRPRGVPRISTSWWFGDNAGALRIQNVKLGPFNIINEARNKFTNEYRSGSWDGLFSSMDRDVNTMQRNLLKGSKAG